MPNPTHFRKVERMLLNEPVNDGLPGFDLTVTHGHCEVSLRIEPSVIHAGGAAHGSAIFKVLDDAATGAASSLVDDMLMVTSQSSVYFLRPVIEGDTMRAVAQVSYQSRRLIVVEVEATNSAGKSIARATMQLMPSNIALSPQIGYTDE